MDNLEYISRFEWILSDLWKTLIKWQFQNFEVNKIEAKIISSFFISVWGCPHYFMLFTSFLNSFRNFSYSFIRNETYIRFSDHATQAEKVPSESPIKFILSS